MGTLISDVLLHYRYRDNGHRYREIEKIKAIPSAKQFTVKAKSPKQRVKILLAKANWAETKFQEKMREAIVIPVENCVTIHDLCKAFDLDALYYEYDKFGQEVTLKDPLYKFLTTRPTSTPS